MENISVVMATNRIDSYLDDAIQSVFANKGINIELVLVLDGIPFPVSHKDLLSDKRIKVVQKIESAGLGAALNTGINSASHEIIARLDADDNCYPTRFEEQLTILKGPNAPVLIGSKMVIINEFGEIQGESKQDCGADLRKNLLLQNVIPHSSYMFLKSNAIEIGLYREDLKQMEDYDFLLRIAMKGPIAKVCHPLIEYRVHSGQMSKRAAWKANYITAVIEARNNLGNYLEVSKFQIAINNFIWRSVQFARSLKLFKPRHLLWLRK